MKLKISLLLLPCISSKHRQRWRCSSQTVILLKINLQFQNAKHFCFLLAFQKLHKMKTKNLIHFYSFTSTYLSVIIIWSSATLSSSDSYVIKTHSYFFKDQNRQICASAEFPLKLLHFVKEFNIIRIVKCSRRLFRLMLRLQP